MELNQSSMAVTLLLAILCYVHLKMHICKLCCQGGSTCTFTRQRMEIDYTFNIDVENKIYLFYCWCIL